MSAGLIVMWSGLLANIPNGWLLCDGTSGTPDLRERFILGTADGIDPGGVGGSSQHSHTITGDGHTHDIPGGSGLQAGAVFDDQTSSTAITGVTGLDDHLPPYYNLAFLMKS